MLIFPFHRQKGSSGLSSPLWHRLSSLAVLLFAIGLFLLSLKSDIYHSLLSAFLVSCLLIALGGAVFLHIYYFLRSEKEQREADRAFHITNCESTSIFQNVLDGILIIDDQGVCLDSNPAALSILGVSREELIGLPFGQFYADRDVFNRNWDSFRQTQYQRGRSELVRGDGSPIIADYTASANYIPGRHIIILCDVTERVHAEEALRQKEQLLQQVTDNVQEAVWMMNAETKEILYVSKAYEAITGRALSTIYEDPSSYKEVIHPEDRIRVLTNLEEAAITGRFDEEFRILRPDGVMRWVWSKATPMRDANQVIHRLVGVAQDVTSRKNAEAEVTKLLAVTEGARREADALRKATLTLTQFLRMDTLLDTLLETLRPIVPYDSACVLLTDTDHTFLLARQVPRERALKTVVILDANKNHFLQKVSVTRKSLILEDTRMEIEWRDTSAFGGAGSWICIPLLASDHLIGLLSVSSKEPGRFTHEHLRLAESLALSAAVAIQNARLYERAEIYASELELKLEQLKETQAALEQTQIRSSKTTN
jgi:PAS domain S-box-containing protein